jgi:hypothetical protein
MAGQFVMTINGLLAADEKVMFNPGMPVTGIALPEAAEVYDGPRSVQLTKPSCGKPVVEVTLWMPEETGLSDDSITTAPPAGAAPVKVAVPIKELPPTTLAGVNVTVESTAGSMVRVASRRHITAGDIHGGRAVTELVFTGKVAAVAPAGTVTLPALLSLGVGHGQRPMEVMRIDEATGVDGDLEIFECRRRGR